MSVPKQRLPLLAKRTVSEFLKDECLDLAAALTYYSVLAIFPAVVALTALLGVVGQAEESIDTMLSILDPLLSDKVLGNVEPTVRQLAESDAAGFALAAGVLGALWSASAYVNAFSRAMNRIYEVDEGRPIWKLRPQMLLVTLVSIVLLALVALLLVVSGGLALAIGDVLGFGSGAVAIWNIAKWPALALVALFLIALLYWATPNVQHPKFRWLTPGALLALVTWLAASVALTFYVSNFSSYDKTYGSLAGVIVGLLFLWVSNAVLLLGAEVDAEIERGRQLERGIAAESHLQLPLRDTRQIDKAQQKEHDQVSEARAWREEESEHQLIPGEETPVPESRDPD